MMEWSASGVEVDASERGGVFMGRELKEYCQPDVRSSSKLLRPIARLQIRG